MHRDAPVMVIDDGGGGTPYAIDSCGKLLHVGQARTAAIVASSFVSPLLDLESGEVRPGGEDCVVLAGVGANVHFGGQVIRP